MKLGGAGVRDAALRGTRPRHGAPGRGPRSLDRVDASEIDDLRGRVADLEGRLRALAVSRRVLISLLVSSDKRRKLEVARLQSEVERLRDRFAKSARAVSLRDAVIHRLRFQMSDLLSPGPLADVPGLGEDEGLPPGSSDGGGVSGQEAYRISPARPDVRSLIP